MWVRRGLRYEPVNPLRTSLRAWPAVLLGGIVLAVLVLDPAHGLLLELMRWTQGLIEDRPATGAAAFVIASAASAMLAFLSSAVLIPAATYAWGPWATGALLWLGWIIGGGAAYAIGRGIGRPLFAGPHSSSRLAHIRAWLPERITLGTALLVQLSLPSEVPGYLFGILRLRPGTYLLAAALGELPYAVLAVALSQGLLDRRWPSLLAAGAAAIVLLLASLAMLHRRRRHQPRG